MLRALYLLLLVLQGAVQGVRQKIGKPRDKLEGHVSLPDAAIPPEAAAWRAAQIRNTVQYAWDAYEAHAWAHDELKPVTREGGDEFGGFGLTIVDSLDTLLMLEMQAEYERAVQWVVTQLSFDKVAVVSMFELNIRIVGGLLSAAQLANDSRLADKAADLASRFLPAFDVETGIPVNFQRLPYAAPRRTDVVALADVGTFSLEFASLTALLLANGSKPMGDGAADARAFERAATRVVQRIMQAYPSAGLVPSQLFQMHPQKAATHLQPPMSVGGPSDSYYEYLLKYWLIKGKSKEAEPYRAAWERTVDDVLERLYVPTPAHPEAAFLGVLHPDTRGGPIPRQEHLACFFPGNIALGVMAGAVPKEKQERYMDAAATLTQGCWLLYSTSPIGLSPEALLMHEPSGGRLLPVEPHNCLRPEVVETLFYMWRATRNTKYRAQGWAIFQAFEAHAKVEGGGGYTGLTHAYTDGPLEPDNAMPSFFLAETLKYLWLLFSPDDALDLDAWVLNTEAHPLRVQTPTQ